MAPQQQVFLLGPQVTNWTEGQLTQLQKVLLDNNDLGFLTQALVQLPSLSSILGQQLGLDFQPSRSFHELADFAQGGRLLLENSDWRRNTLLAPLTIVSQTVDFTVRLKGIQPHEALLQTNQQVQGFCIGWLSAASIASSKHWDDFKQNISAALRLAACIGAAVDADSSQNPSHHADAMCVRLKTQADRALLETLLDQIPGAYISCFLDETLTITVPKSKRPWLEQQLQKATLSWTDIGIFGYFHHSRHEERAQTLKRICFSDPKLQLPAAADLRSPLRSTADANIIAANSQSLHDIAIDLTLCKRVHWLQTLRNTVGDLDNFTFIPVGSHTGGLIPRSLLHPRLPPSMVSSPDTKTAPKDEIAIIGMSARFPASDSLSEFWNLLVSGKTGFGPLPVSRFDSSDPSVTSRCSKAQYQGNFLSEEVVKGFDHRFFGISGREAKSMDPQQRLILQVAYEALAMSGYHQIKSQNKETEVGVYMGVGEVEYENNLAGEQASSFSAVGMLRSFISGRISHFFGWNGPAMTIDTACSSSAVAVHTACKALKNVIDTYLAFVALLTGECRLALAGGVNLITSPELHQALAAGSFLNPNGSSSQAFDKSANGYCRGEGSGILVLKPLSKAVADGDLVLGVIAASAVNQNSNCSSITVPESSSQSSLYNKVMDMAGVSPGEVSYVEAHGTGTQVGDPKEYESIRMALCGPFRNDELFVGSVKDSIGHCEAASGVAGIIKSVLMLQFSTIPPQAGFVTLNPRIKTTSADRITIPKTARPWQTAGRRLALVNNYGAAGSNAAILLREYRDPAATTFLSAPTPSTSTYPVLLSAKSPKQLQSMMAALKAWTPPVTAIFKDIAYNINKAQNHEFPHRVALTASDYRDMISHLNTRAATMTSVSTQLPVVLAFGGQTGRSVSISKSLYDSSPILRHHLDHCDKVCVALSLPSIFPDIFSPSTPASEDIIRQHCQLLSLQVSTARCWLDAGLDASNLTLIGHSFGQISALVVAGSLTLADGFRFVAGRARLIRDFCSDGGRMLSVDCPDSHAKEIIDAVNKSLEQTGKKIEVACYNGPTSLVLAGEQEAVTQAEQLCREQGIKSVMLPSRHAYHSHLTETILEKLAEVSESLVVKPPSLKIETCTFGKSWDRFTAGNLVRHTREPVFFADAVTRIAASHPQGAVWLEAGSASPVIPMIKRLFNKSVGRSSDLFLPVSLGDDGAISNVATLTSQLWQAGCSVQHWPFLQFGPQNRFNFVPIPPYQFEKTQHWIDYKPRGLRQSTDLIPQQDDSSADLITLLNVDQASAKHTFQVNTNAIIFQLATKGHAVTGQALCPASMYLEIVARCVQVAVDMPSENLPMPHFEGLTMSSPLSLSHLNTTVLVSLHQEAQAATNTWSFIVFSLASNAGTAAESMSTQHATGRIALSSAETDTQLRVMSKMFRKSRLDRLDSLDSSSKVAGPMVYQLFSSVVDYAKYYHGVKCLTAHGNEAVGFVGAPVSETPAGLHKGICDPVALDNFLQVAGIHVNCLSSRESGQVFMCTAIEEVIFSPTYSRSPAEWRVYTRYEMTSGTEEMINDILVFEAKSNDLVAAITGATFRGVSLKSLERSLSRLNGTTRPASLPQTKPTRPVQSAPTPTHHHHPPFQATEGHNTAATQTLFKEDYDIKQMLSSIIEMPADEITSTSTFSELGIDSLLAGEVLAEIETLFRLKISQVELLECSDVAALAGLVRQRSAGQTSLRPASETSQPELFDTTELEPLTSTDSSGSEVESSTCDSSYTVDSTEEHATAGSECGNSDTNKQSDIDITDLAGFGWASFPQATVQYTRHASTTLFSDFCTNVYPLQSQLVTQYVVSAFADLDYDLSLMAPGSEVPFLRSFDARHNKLVPQLYRILEDSKLITRDEVGRYRRTHMPLDPTSASALYAQMLSQFPQHTSETKLLNATASQFAACLTGAADPIDILFGTASARALLEDVYLNAPMFRTGTLVLIDYLSSLVQTSNRKTIRILEIGAGTGGTTRPLLQALSQIERPDISVEYTFTDLSASLVAAAKRKFTSLVASHAHQRRVKIEMQFKTLDIESSETKHDGHYDVVLSTNCIHATKNLVVSASHIRRLLDPVEGGILCLVELTRNLYWFDLVFGLLEGWWRFDDGRTHALADELVWERCLKQAGFASVKWSDDGTQEGNILRVIAAYTSPQARMPQVGEETRVETACFKSIDGVDLMADIYYPPSGSVKSTTPRPVALMIHGGGHIMLSRADIRPDQTELLLSKGFIPVSIDYRLCPETTLLEGPMEDTASALAWIRNTLPSLSLARKDIQIDGERVVAIGWSTGGLLAMTLCWNSTRLGIRPPEAVLAFYCPSDYQDSFWKQPNIPEGSQSVFPISVGQGTATFCQPITAYNPPASAKAVGGWMSDMDPRSRLALYMNHHGKTLEVLLHGLTAIDGQREVSEEDIVAVSPLAQVQQGRYKTPTFLIHPRQDDLIPWQQAQRTYEALRQEGVDAELRIIDGGARHLFDIGKQWEMRYPQGSEAVREGYEFLEKHVR
ncbi:hypothetical protein B0T21DRAFT_393084 [Apiosordaria backusii]|uniref:S-adenosyl-L-methionine-dependent N-methyltransferase n=1 Tax=Apiosordaria backusii TaxID=314023 RepID=A0AA40BLC1_9PEZI|nr:hypothetical protein B0T21DRAFT_393084 [Apiosordaria backusii]